MKEVSGILPPLFLGRADFFGLRDQEDPVMTTDQIVEMVTEYVDGWELALEHGG